MTMGASRLAALVAVVVLAACAGRPVPEAPRPTMDPGRVVPPVVVPPALPPVKTPVIPPTEAYRRGLMPLASTNVWAFRQAKPAADGRGVVIGILDSGIDADIVGLDVTTMGSRKILDLRDFSGEGRIVLTPLGPHGDTAIVAGTRLAGLQRVTALDAAGMHYAGAIVERGLGEMPGSDLNGDGDNADRLPLVVARASDGWVVFADTDGDGTLADERPVHDYLVAKEVFGWTVAGRKWPMTVAANFGSASGPPTLDLFFDNSGHGTHVAGIAAGNGLYGVRGFDGVAPGAQLLGLKIANNAAGGVSVTGSMVRSIDYAIRFAKSRQLPLVLNMSFGVGNERNGAARIDALLDSILAANPEVVFVTSAGNDGPGLSTLGFPGSADRVLSVGATYPPAFLPGAVAGDVVAFFSSRGGEAAKPDIMAPGIAYSSVPRWETGSEDKSGTSMASPHVAGAVALLLSALQQERRSATSGQVKQAIVATGRALPASLRVDQGGGLLDLVAADRVLRRLPVGASVRLAVGGVPGAGVYRILDPNRPATDTTVMVEILGSLGGPVRLTSNTAWVEPPGQVQLTPPRTSVPMGLRGSALRDPGVFGATVTGWATDTAIGPLFRLPVTVVHPVLVGDSGARARGTIQPGGTQRVVFAADSGRPFRVQVGTATLGQDVLAFLHEPGGQPFRVENGKRAGAGTGQAEYDVDGRNVEPGYYEVVAVAPPTGGATVTMTIDQSPLAIDASRLHADTVTVQLTNRTKSVQSAATVLALVGGERALSFSQKGSAVRRLSVPVPAWAKRVEVDLRVSRATWPLFTDMGLTLLDGHGQVLVANPMNYHFGRVTADFDSAAAVPDLTIAVAPGFADPFAEPLWDGMMAIRFYAETPMVLEPTGSAERSVAVGGQSTVRFPLGRTPWPLGDGFFPLGQLLVEVNGSGWGREVRLPEPLPPIMR